MILSKREKILLSILIVLIVATSYYYLVIAPRLVSLKKIKIKNKEIREELKLLKSDLNSEDSAKSEVTRLKSSLNHKMKAYFPDSSREKLITTLDDLTKDIQITVNTMKFENIDQENSKEDGYKEIGVETLMLSLETDYYSFEDFLKNVSNYPRKISIGNLIMSKEESGKIKADLVMNFYYLKQTSENKDLLNKNEIKEEGTRGDPFLEFIEYEQMKNNKDKKEEDVLD